MFCYIYFNLFYLFILLYNIVLVLPYIDLNPPWVYMCSPSWTPLPHPSPSHPSGSSQFTSPEHPVSCIEPGLAIHFTYNNFHVSMLFSHIIPPLPSPTESKRLFKWPNNQKKLLIITKEPLDENERGEWKSWLEAQHPENWDHGIWWHFIADRWGNSGHSGWL